MKINRRMAQKLITVSPDANVLDVLNVLHQNSIRHLPVMENEKFVGFLSESDIRQVLLLPGGKDMRVEEFMNRQPITIGPEENLEDAAKLIYYYKLRGLPVLDDGKLVGVITVGDILAAFIEIMGVLQASSRIDVMLGEKPEAFEDLSRLIKAEGGEIISVGMGNLPEEEGKICFFRLKKCDVGRFVDVIENNGYEVGAVIE